MDNPIDDYKRKPPFEPTHISKILAEVFEKISKRQEAANENQND